MVTHSSTLAWEIPWMGEPGGLPSTGSQRVRNDLATKQQQAFGEESVGSWSIFTLQPSGKEFTSQVGGWDVHAFRKLEERGGQGRKGEERGEKGRKGEERGGKGRKGEERGKSGSQASGSWAGPGLDCCLA